MCILVSCYGETLHPGSVQEASYPIKSPQMSSFEGGAAVLPWTPPEWSLSSPCLWGWARFPRAHSVQSTLVLVIGVSKECISFGATMLHSSPDLLMNNISFLTLGGSLMWTFPAFQFWLSGSWCSETRHWLLINLITGGSFTPISLLSSVVVYHGPLTGVN